ncbi:CRISPR-associated endonuclease Cas2 [Paenibacillus sp. P96]|uniref:CRISPR-associated endonuclease Cas2 n=1 Tax=Paenibacillus zeirhizosphaerae TaxID=2987519 RepID=A0ABT9FWL0_9BACL|nr:CRISPR-associated endonuclease Cas2 [Paenibacillus sp. P96]MDP4099107.1 CRISPR-associated endonuclease Cas2 [Paenibacillus sp. P96]
MLILITYDVSTVEKEGRHRRTKVANKCVDHGQRVQNLVFECIRAKESCDMESPRIL